MIIPRLFDDQVVAVFRICGAMRCKEISEIRVNDMKKEGRIFVVHVEKTKTKIKRTFVIDKTEYVGLVDQYRKMRPTSLKKENFFFNYRKGKAVAQVLGVNQFYKFPERIATFLQIPNAKEYTGRFIITWCLLFPV